MTTNNYLKTIVFALLSATLLGGCLVIPIRIDAPLSYLQSETNTTKKSNPKITQFLQTDTSYIGTSDIHTLGAHLGISTHSLSSFMDLKINELTKTTLNTTHTFTKRDLLYIELFSFADYLVKYNPEYEDYYLNEAVALEYIRFIPLNPYLASIQDRYNLDSIHSTLGTRYTYAQTTDKTLDYFPRTKSAFDLIATLGVKRDNIMGNVELRGSPKGYFLKASASSIWVDTIGLKLEAVHSSEATQKMIIPSITYGWRNHILEVARPIRTHTDSEQAPIVLRYNFLY